ncbi:MAG TPA: hypothetical protein VFD47_10040, partial [Actinomycetota bacterium]|nr:hypothetical protein [Actinomycetota bacterium]
VRLFVLADLGGYRDRSRELISARVVASEASPSLLLLPIRQLRFSRARKWSSRSEDPCAI